MSFKSKGQNPSPRSETQRHCAPQVDGCLVTKQPHPASLTHMPDLTTGFSLANFTLNDL